MQSAAHLYCMWLHKLQFALQFHLAAVELAQCYYIVKCKFLRKSCCSLSVCSFFLELWILHFPWICAFEPRYTFKTIQLGVKENYFAIRNRLNYKWNLIFFIEEITLYHLTRGINLMPKLQHCHFLFTWIHCDVFNCSLFSEYFE